MVDETTSSGSAKASTSAAENRDAHPPIEDGHAVEQLFTDVPARTGPTMEEEMQESAPEKPAAPQQDPMAVQPGKTEFEMRPRMRLGNYVVAAMLVPAWVGDGAIVLATDSSGNKCIIQHIPIPELTLQDLNNRRARFNHVVKILKSAHSPGLVHLREAFEHEGHMFLVFECPSETTMEAHCESNSMLSAEQALNWAVKLCRTMASLENQAMPFTLDRLGTVDVLIDAKGEPWLFNLRLQRVFQPGSLPVRAATTADRAKTYESFGTMLFYLATHTDRESKEAENVIRVVGKVASTCRNQVRFRSIKRFSQVLEALEESRHPPEAEQLSPRKVLKAELPTLRFLLRRMGQRFLSQPRPLIALELLIVCLLPWWLGVTLPTAKLPPTPNSIYVVSRNGEFVSIDEASGQVRFSPRAVGFRVSCACVTPGGADLVLCSEKEPKAVVLSTQTHERLGKISLKQPALKVVLAARGTVAYFISSGSVAMVSLSDLHLKGTFNLSKTPSDAAPSADGRLLYLSIPLIKAVWVMDTRRGSVVNTIQVPIEPGPLTVSPDGKKLWVASPQTDSVMTLSLEQATNPDVTIQRLLGQIDNVGGHKPVGLHCTSDGRFLLALCRDTSTVGRIQTSDRTVTVSNTGGTKPVDWCEWNDEAIWIANEGDAAVGLYNPIKGRLVSWTKTEVAPFIVAACHVQP